MIETYLATHDLTQAEFARRVGVTQGLVWQWINGRTQITAEKAIAIERATGGEIGRDQLRPDVFSPDGASAPRRTIARRTARVL